MQVRIFQPQCYGVRRCVVHGLCRSRLHSTRQKIRHHAWHRLATRHQGEMWPLQMVTAAGRRSLSHRQKHRNLQHENLQFTIGTLVDLHILLFVCLVDCPHYTVVTRQRIEITRSVPDIIIKFARHHCGQ